MRQDLLKHFGMEKDSYYEDTLNSALEEAPEYAFAINTGHAKEIHTFHTHDEFITNTAMRLCNEKENHTTVSAFADPKIVMPILKESLYSQINKISQWAQFGKKEEPVYTCNIDYGDETGFVVDKDLKVYSTTGIQLVLQKVPVYDNTCPFGFYLKTAYPASDKVYCSKEAIGQLDKYGILAIPNKNLRSRLDQIAFLHINDHPEVKIKRTETPWHDQEISLQYKEDSTLHNVYISKNGKMHYCQHMDNKKIDTYKMDDLAKYCPTLYKLAYNIRDDLREDGKSFDNRIKQGKIHNDKILEKIDEHVAEILPYYVDEYDTPSKEEFPKDRFALSSENKIDDKENTLSSLDEEIEDMLKEQANDKEENISKNINRNEEYFR